MASKFAKCRLNETVSSCRSKIELEADRCTYTWYIENYNDYYGSGNSRPLTSSRFSTGNSGKKLFWKLKIRPKVKVGHTEQVGIYLHLCKGESIQFAHLITVSVCLVDANGARRNKKVRGFPFAEFITARNCGWNNFIRKDDLLSGEYLTANNTLEVQCVVEVSHKATLVTDHRSCRFPDARYLETLSANMRTLQEIPKHSDVVLRAGNKVFHAHKAILSARSPVFSRMFGNDMKETRDSIVCIDDIQEDILEELLRFVYYARIGDISSDASIELYTAADKYCLLDLKQLCSYALANSLSSDNWFAIANLSEIHEDTRLFSAINRFLYMNYAKVAATSQWARLVLDKPSLVCKIVNAYFYLNSESEKSETNCSDTECSQSDMYGSESSEVSCPDELDEEVSNDINQI